MVVQKTIDNLKDRPHDEKKVVAGGIAVFVVVALLVGWGFLFLRKIQTGTYTPSDSAVPRDQLNQQFTPQTELDAIYQSSLDELRALRDSATQNQVPANASPQNSAGSDFGTGF